MSITAIILAAGEGKRIKPLVTPKPLFSFCGQPLINWLVADLQAAGVNKILVIVNPKNHDDFKKISGIELVQQPKPLGMADALLKAKDKIKTDSMMVINGDDVISTQGFSNFLKTIHQKNPEILLSGLKVSQYLSGGYYQLKEGRPVGLVEKPGDGNQPSQYFNVVLHYFKNAADFIAGLSQIKSSEDDVYEVALNQSMKLKTVSLFKYQDYYGQIKYPWQILDVMNIFLKHRLKKKISSLAKISKKAVIIGSVEIAAEAQVMANAVIKGPAYIGSKVIIGNNVLIRRSMIESGSVIGYNSEVARSYIGPQSYLHCNFVGDSVIEGNVNLGSGSRLANLRFDEKEILLKTINQPLITKRTKLGAILAQGVKLGINVSIMPGVAIGEQAVIGAGLVINQAISPKSKIFSNDK